MERLQRAFLDVAVQMLRRHVVVGADAAAFEVAPVVLDAVGVDRSADVLAGTARGRGMGIAQRRQRPV